MLPTLKTFRKASTFRKSIALGKNEVFRETDEITFFDKCLSWLQIQNR